jgi:hypothetical protein
MENQLLGQYLQKAILISHKTNVNENNVRDKTGSYKLVSFIL